MPTARPLYAPLLKKGQSWCVEYYIEIKGDRKRIRRSQTADGRELNAIADIHERERVGEAMVAEIKAKITPPVLAPEQTLFSEALDIAVGLKHSLKKATNKGFSENARWMKEYFAGRGWQHLRCTQLAFDHVQAYFDHQVVKLKVRNSTYNSRKNNLRSLFTELVKRKYLPANYVSQITNRKIADPVRRPISNEEFLVIVNHFYRNDPVMLLATLLLGLLAIRPGELRDLRCGSVDLKSGFVRFPGDHSKNNRASVVTIPADVVAVLQTYHLDAYPDTHYIFGGGKGKLNLCKPGPIKIGVNTLAGRFQRAIALLHKEGKIGDTTGLQFYSLKDYLALYLLDHGVDLESAMRHFRHSDLNTFQRYVKRLGVENKAIRSLPVSMPGLVPDK